LGRKERYVLAMALLLAIGLSVAWAGYSTAAIATISTDNNIGSSASVQKSSSSLSLSNLKKNQWFYKDLGSVFTISNVDTNLTVVVGVINMAELQNYFKSLDINVSLKVRSSGAVKDWGVLSLEGGTSSVILNATVSSGSSLTIDVYVYVQGLPSVTTSSPVRITMYCAIEPAKAVQA
jgi:hypothetical protein